MTLRALIVGPQGSGKGFLHDVMAASPDLPQPGTFEMQSAPARRLRAADRYILVRRELAWASIERRYWRLPNLDGRTVVARSWAQIDRHVAGYPTLDVQYRQLVDDLPAAIEAVALFLGVPAWTYAGAVRDGDADFA